MSANDIYYEYKIMWPRLCWGLYTMEFFDYYMWRDIYKAFPKDVDLNLKDENEIEPEENSGVVILGTIH